MSNNIKSSILAGVDKAVGVLYGLFRGIGILLCFCMLLLVLNISKSKYSFISESKLSAILFPIAESFVPKIYKLKTLKQKTGKKIISKINLTEITKPKIKKEKVKEEEHTEKTKSLILEKIKDWLADFVAKRQAGVEEDVKEIPRPIQQQQEKYVRPADKPPYGTGISLLEARRKRRAQIKAEKLKKELRKRLDSSDI